MLELLNIRVTLEKFAGKGSWTFARIGKLPIKPRTHFGLVKVCGRLDEVALEKGTLMPFGKGGHFLPVNAALRKQLGKQAGDEVQLQLFALEEPAALSISLADFTDCLAEVPAALLAFQTLAPAQQQQWLGWVAAADNDELQVARMEAAMQQLGAGTALPPEVGAGSYPAGLVSARR
jgi:hypothetical protein